VVTVPLLPQAPPPALVRPVVLQPAPREVSFGTVAGRVGPATARVIVRVDGVVKAEIPMTAEPRRSGYRFRARVALPPRDVTVSVTAIDDFGNTARTVVSPVFGLPRAAYPVGILSSEDRVLADRIRELARGYSGVSSVFVQDLRTGRGAAWNARARFQGASTLKLGIAIEVLRVLHGKPKPGTRVAQLFRKMLVYSSNQAANELEVWLGGSMQAGAARATATLHALGLADTYINGGYIIGTAARRPIPLRIESQPPYFTLGKYTTAWDLARIHCFVHRGAVGRGPLMNLRGYFRPADARYMLFTLAHVQDPGKIDRYIRDKPGLAVLHKAGWITHARHDSGIVVWPGGAFVVTVMTWHPILAGEGADILAGRVAAAALRRFSAYMRDPHARLLRS
jgi:Beta-lactamase enzyme family